MIFGCAYRDNDPVWPVRSDEVFQEVLQGIIVPEREGNCQGLGLCKSKINTVNTMKRYSRKIRLWFVLAAAAIVPVMPVSGQKLFLENFDSLPLGLNPEEASQGANVWTRTPPAGWSIDDTGMPGFGTPEYAASDGRTEWSGWAFADVKWWPTVDDQRRSEFTLASGAAAIADPDEWDDATHLFGLFNSYLNTPSISVAGKPVNSLVLTFDSAWRPESRDDGAPNWPVDESGSPTNNQTAVITVQYDNGAAIEVMNWSSISDDPNYHDHFPAGGESIVVPLNNPAGASSMKLKIGLINAANDWYWAFDNLAIGEPPLVTGVSATGIGFTIRITEALGKTVNDNAAITGKLDGQTVTVTDTRDGDRVMVAHDQSPKIFVPGSKHAVEVTFTTGTGQQIVDTADFIAPGYTTVTATPTVVTAAINEKDYLSVDESKGVKLELDGAAITAQSVTRVNLTAADGTDLPDRIDVVYTATNPFAPASSHSLKVTFTTKTAQEVVETVSFKAPDYAKIPTGLATALGTGAQAGMKWKTHQVASRGNTIADTEKQLAGELGPSEHDPSAEVAGGYFEIPYVNFDQNGGDAGNFNSSAQAELAVQDEYIPGIPGLNGSVDYVAGEALAYVEIPQPGGYSMVVNSDDGFQVSVGNASAPTYLVLGSFDAGRSQADTSFFFWVDKAGVYLFRLLYFEGTGDARVEWFTVNANGTRALVNGTQTGALKAYRTRTVAEPPLPSLVDYSIGLNFGADEPDGGNKGGLAAGDKAGVSKMAQANWNNLSGIAGTNTAIVGDAQGASQPTSVTVTWTCPNTWSSTGRGEENNQFAEPNKTLMLGYLDTGNASTTPVTILNLPEALTSEGYDVYVYALGGVGARGGGYRIVDADTKEVLKDYIRAQGPTNNTDFVQVAPSQATNVWGVGNYMVFSGLNAANIIVEATTANGLGFSGTPRAPINAIQLVAPPSSTPPPPKPKVSIEQTAAGVTITFTGTLQSADQVEGPYSDVVGTSPMTVTPAAGSVKFYRSVNR